MTADISVTISLSLLISTYIMNKCDSIQFRNICQEKIGRFSRWLDPLRTFFIWTNSRNTSSVNVISYFNARDKLRLSGFTPSFIHIPIIRKAHLEMGQLKMDWRLVSRNSLSLFLNHSRSLPPSNRKGKKCSHTKFNRGDTKPFVRPLRALRLFLIFPEGSETVKYFPYQYTDYSAGGGFQPIDFCC